MAKTTEQPQHEVKFGREYEITKTNGGITFTSGESVVGQATLMPSAAHYGTVPLIAVGEDGLSGGSNNLGVAIWEVDSSRDYVANHYGMHVHLPELLVSQQLALSITPYVRSPEGRWVPEVGMGPGDQQFYVTGLTSAVPDFYLTSPGWRTYRAGKDAALIVIGVSRAGREIARTPLLALPNYKLEAAIGAAKMNRKTTRSLGFEYSPDGMVSIPNVKPALFGTSGVRGKVGYDIGEDTILATSQALLNHIREQNLAGPIIVGGDTRMSSEDFARTAAEVFAANWHQLSPDGNYPAVLFMDVPIVEQSRTNAAARPESNAADHVPSSRKPFVPTPLMTFVIRQETEKRPRAAAGATMTASHNYGTDNGYKTLRGITGGIAEQTVTDQLQLEANAMLARRDIIHKLDFEMALNLEIGRVRASDGAERVVHAIERYDPRAAYFRQHLGRYVDFDVIRKSKPMVAVDLLYGTGIGFLDRVLEREVAREEWPIVQQRFHDWREPGFGGSRPDCEDPENIRDMIRYCADHRETVDVGLAVDSDSDRFGVVDPELGLVNANHILAALYRYRHDNPLGRPVELMGSDLPVCRTIVTSHMLDAMAKRLGGKILALQRIGFKWIGDVMNKEGMKFVIAGEESSGLSVLDFPEKDGILADLLVLEMMCAYGQVEAAQGKRERPVKPLREILEEIWSEYGRWHFHRVDMYGIKRKQKVMDYFRHVYRPAEIAGHAMEEPDKIKAMFSFYGEDDRDNLLIEENRVHGFNPLVGDGVKYYLKVTAAEMRGSEHAPWLDDGIVNASVHVRESGNEPVIRVYTQHRTSRQAMLAIEAQIVDLIREVDQ